MIPRIPGGGPPPSRRTGDDIRRGKGHVMRERKAQTWEGDQPLLSVVVPCYNHGHVLPEAVDSVLSQTWQDLEILVVNDGSTDPETRDVLAGFSRPRTRVLHHDQNLGLPSARNTGVREARGKYICCLDADDKLHPTYLEKALTILETNLGLHFIYAWTQVFGAESRVWYNPPFDPEQLLDRNLVFTAAVFLRSAWQHIGGFREEMTAGYEDWEFWIRLARAGCRGYRIPEKLLLVRREGRSFIHRAMERHDQLVADIQRYNPRVYQDRSWIEEVKDSYRDRYAERPFRNLANPARYASLKNPITHIIKGERAGSSRWLSRTVRKVDAHPGAYCLVSYRALEESQVDRLCRATPYVYVLPHLLPDALQERYLDEVFRPARGHPPRG